MKTCMPLFQKHDLNKDTQVKENKCQILDLSEVQVYGKLQLHSASQVFASDFFYRLCQYLLVFSSNVNLGSVFLKFILYPLRIRWHLCF